MNLKQLFKVNVDKTATDEDKFFKPKNNHDGHVEFIVVLTLWCDFIARYVIALVIFCIAIGNYILTFFIVFGDYHYFHWIKPNIDPTLVSIYIKYGIGFNTALLLVLSYWFSNSGASSLLKQALQDVAARKLAKQNLTQKNHDD